MKKVAIFGAGNCGRLIAREILSQGQNLIAFIDNDKSKEGSFIKLDSSSYGGGGRLVANK